MREARLKRIAESGAFTWPWRTPSGLLIITGAAGGGGGGGGALCIQGLNVHGTRGGRGGLGGVGTTVTIIGQKTYQAAGGSGGGGGDGGGLIEGKPEAANGLGCHYGDGGKGGQGAVVLPGPERTVSNGGDGGKGFPGETLVVELEDLSIGDRFQITVGEGGDGGDGGEGHEKGSAGGKGADGSVIFVPVFEEQGNI